MQWGRKRFQTGYRIGDAKGGADPLPGAVTGGKHKQRWY
jgi:hypothetical protein